MGNPLFTHTLDQHGQHVRLTLAGELDMSVATQLQAALDKALALHPHTLTVDIDTVTFIDSHSIGLLIRACNITRAAGRAFAVVNPRDLVHQVLHLMGLLDHFAYPGSADAAGM